MDCWKLFTCKRNIFPRYTFFRFFFNRCRLTVIFENMIFMICVWHHHWACSEVFYIFFWWELSCKCVTIFRTGISPDQGDDCSLLKWCLYFDWKHQDLRMCYNILKDWKGNNRGGSLATVIFEHESYEDRYLCYFYIHCYINYISYIIWLLSGY